LEIDETSTSFFNQTYSFGQALVLGSIKGNTMIDDIFGKSFSISSFALDPLIWIENEGS